MTTREIEFSIIFALAGFSWGNFFQCFIRDLRAKKGASHDR